MDEVCQRHADEHHDAGEAEAEIEAIAKRRSAQTGVSYEKAYSEVLTTPEGGPALRGVRRGAQLTWPWPTKRPPPLGLCPGPAVWALPEVRSIRGHDRLGSRAPDDRMCDGGGTEKKAHDDECGADPSSPGPAPCGQ